MKQASEELLDVYDEHGQKTGVAKSIAEVHQEGLWHYAAHLWIINNSNEVLVQTRSRQNMHHPGEFDCSANGHVAAGETSLDTIVRETKEELGLSLHSGDFCHIGKIINNEKYDDIGHINKEFIDVYVIHENIPIDQIRIELDEVEQVRYVPVETYKQWIAKGRNVVTQQEEIDLVMKQACS